MATAGFTAASTLVGVVLGTCFADDFNRGSLGSNWVADDGTAYISGNELVLDAETHSDFLTVNTGFNPVYSEAQMDFWVPPDPTDGYHGYEIDSSNRWVYFENLDQSFVQSVNWTFYGVEGASVISYTVTGDTWYTIKMRSGNKAAHKQYIKVWPRDDPEPDQWTAVWNLSSNTTSLPPALYIDAQNGVSDPSIYQSKIDNFSSCAAALQSVRSFTADAVISSGGQITADAIVKKTQLYDGNAFVRDTRSYVSAGLTDAVPMPTTAQDDLVIAFITLESFSSPAVITSVPSGWTFIKSGYTYYQPGSEQAFLAAYFHRVGTTPEPATYSWTSNQGNSSYLIVSIGNASGVGQSFVNGSIGDNGVTEVHAWTAPELTTEYYNSLVLASWHGDNFMLESQMVDPSGWTDAGIVLGITNAWTKGYQYSSAARGTVVEPTASWPTRNFVYTAGSIILEVIPDTGVIYANAVINSDEHTFTADAVIEKVIHPFTADSTIRRVNTIVIVANAYLILSTTASNFTAAAVIRGPADRFFTANAVIYRDQSVAPGLPRLRRSTTLTILERRDKPLDPYVPPRVPDEEEEDPDPEVGCLPPCAGVGAGGDMNGWGSIKISMTKCSFCDNYFRSDSEYLGQGSGGMASAEHCGYCGSHQRDNHVTRLWVNYPQVPAGNFLMRAKLTWDVNGPDNVSVIVYSVSSFPSTAVDGCEGSSFDAEWNGGTEVGRLDFVNDAEVGGYVLLGGQQYRYQDQPSEVELNGSILQSNVFMFALDDESTYLSAKFRASTLEWPG